MKDTEETYIYITKWSKKIWKECIFYDSNYTTFWKRQNYKDRRLPGVGRKKGWKALYREFLGQWYYDTCHYTLTQMHGMYNPNNEPQCKLWTLGDSDISMQVHQLWQMYHTD